LKTLSSIVQKKPAPKTVAVEKTAPSVAQETALAGIAGTKTLARAKEGAKNLGAKRSNDMVNETVDRLTLAQAEKGP
jgi:hypothetical protein